MNRRFILLVLLLCLLCSVSLTTAQANGTPLLDLLTLVPAQGLSDLYYTDFSAIAQAYPPARPPTDWSEYDWMIPQGLEEDFALNVWWHVFHNMNPLMNELLNADSMPEATGVDFFQIDRTLVHTSTTNEVYYFQGDFDIDAMQSALRARSFVSKAAGGGFALWCGAVGCENSNVAEMVQNTPGDPFGGNFGRQWARLLTPNLMIGANQFADIQHIVDTITGEQSSLATGPDRAAITAVSDQGLLLQAFVTPDYIIDNLSVPGYGLLDLRILYGDPSAAFRELLDAGYETLPSYAALLYADLVSDTEQIVQVVLIYETDSAAQTATDVLSARLETYRSFRTHHTLPEMLSQFRVEHPVLEIVPAEGYFTVRITFATPKATAEQIVQFGATGRTSDNPDVTEPASLYRFITQDDMWGWLTTVPREALEALAGS